MRRFPAHIFGLAFASSFAGPAFAQHITSNVFGVDDTQHFYYLCLQTAPSFSDAERRKTGNYFVKVGEAEPVQKPSRLSATRYYSQRLVENDGSCSCSMTFTMSDQFLSDFLNNFYVTLEREFANSFLSGSQNPTRMLFEFDGVMTEVTILAGQFSNGLWSVSPHATRAGRCPT